MKNLDQIAGKGKGQNVKQKARPCQQSRMQTHKEPKAVVKQTGFDQII